MKKISFILLAHKPPEALKPLIVQLLQEGVDLFLHYDASSNHDINKEIIDWQLGQYTGNLYICEPVRAAWGEWSLVEGVLNALRAAQKIGYQSDYFMLISESCIPVKPLVALRNFLTQNPIDYIEAVNHQDQDWVIQGNQHERWEHYHFFNYMTHIRLFDLSRKIQLLLRIKRRKPLNLIPHMGSQWWCLRVSTVTKILKILDNHKEIEQFYKTTHIPDEHFFQTIVANVIKKDEISNYSLTHYSFSSLGKANTLYNDDILKLIKSNKFFARKISPHAQQLFDYSKSIFPMTDDEFLCFSNNFIKKSERIFLDISMLEIPNRYKKKVGYIDHYESLNPLHLVENPLCLIYSDSESFRKEIFDVVQSLEYVKTIEIYDKNSCTLKKDWCSLLENCNPDKQILLLTNGPNDIEVLNHVKYRSNGLILLIDSGLNANLYTKLSSGRFCSIIILFKCDLNIFKEKIAPHLNQFL